MFGSRKSISGKYSIFRKCYFPEKENVFMCLAVTKFVLRKINFGVWFIQTFLQKMHQIRQKKQNAAKENESNPAEEKMRSRGEGDIERR